MKNILGTKTVTQVIDNFTADLEKAIDKEQKIIKDIDSQITYLQASKNEAVAELQKGIGAVNGIKAMLSGAFAQAADFVEEVTEELEEIVDDIQDAVEDAVDAVEDAVEEVIEDGREAFGSIKESIEDLLDGEDEKSS